MSSSRVTNDDTIFRAYSFPLHIKYLYFKGTINNNPERKKKTTTKRKNYKGSWVFKDRGAEVDYGLQIFNLIMLENLSQYEHIITWAVKYFWFSIPYFLWGQQISCLIRTNFSMYNGRILTFVHVFQLHRSAWIIKCYANQIGTSPTEEVKKKTVPWSLPGTDSSPIYTKRCWTIASIITNATQT